MNKNDNVTITITDMSETGEGIGHLDGLCLFVKNAVVGDTVKAVITKVKKTYCYAKALEILTPSKDRVEPFCTIANPCGGCQLQNLSYDAQLDFKTDKVKSCLERIGGFKLDGSEGFTVERALGNASHAGYRNKAQFPFAKDKAGKTVLGFYAGRTHQVIPTQFCGIQFAGHEEILKAVLEYVEEAHESIYDEETGKGKLRHLFMRKGFATGDIMVALVINGDRIKKPEILVNKLRDVRGIKSIQLNINKERDNAIMGDEMKLLWGESYIIDKIGDVSFKISAKSFYQVNPAMTKVLYDKALEFASLTGTEVVWDMYCGIGTISLFLAKNAGKVYGVEIVDAAVKNAWENAKLNGISNAEFFCGDATEVYKAKKSPADVIMVDPPRKGLTPELIDDMCAMGPGRIVYVSCDPATLARDLKQFKENGYMVQKVQPVDMFPETGHVETVVCIQRKKD